MLVPETLISKLVIALQVLVVLSQLVSGWISKMGLSGNIVITSGK